VLQQLKDNPATRHIPVHVVSSQDNGGEALHLGAIGYALKPTSREQLEEVFRKLKEKSSQKIKRVLLVEDDERQRDSVVQADLRQRRRDRRRRFGEEALALLRTTDFRLHDHRPEAARHAGQRAAAKHVAGRAVLLPAGDRLHRPQPDARGRSRTAEVFALDHHQGRAFAGAPARRSDAVPAQGGVELSSERQTMLKTVRGRDRVFEGRTILLVDDDVRNMFALTSALEQRGAHVEVGRNGFEAIAKLDEVAEASTWC
jgi:CheY-like chemotaxis protein